MSASKPYPSQSDDVIKVPRFEEEGGFYATAKSSAVMSKIRAKNTKAEVMLRRALWFYGCRYRLHAKGVMGRPDIIFKPQKVVIFVDGGFWHGYNWEEKKEKIGTNRAYWIPKIERNMQRDAEVTHGLTEKGWLVLRFWDHEVLQHLDECAAKVLFYVRSNNDTLQEEGAPYTINPADQ